MKKDKILYILMATLLFGCRDGRINDGTNGRFAFTAFTIEGNRASTVPIALFFDKNIGKKARLTGPGWYEYSEIKNGLVQFVTGESDMDRKRVSKYDETRMCDIYDIVYNKESDAEIEVPEDLKNIYKIIIIKSGYQYPYCQGQDIGKLIENLKRARYYERSVIEPGFNALDSFGVRKIIYGKIEGRVEFVRLIGKGETPFGKNGNVDMIGLVMDAKMNRMFEEWANQ